MVTGAKKLPCNHIFHSRYLVVILFRLSEKKTMVEVNMKNKKLHSVLFF